MPSSTEIRTRIVMLAVALTVLSPGVNARGEQVSTVERPTDVEVARALERVKADPNLGTVRTIKTLRWKGAQASEPSRVPEWLVWLAGLFRWVDQSARLLVWAVVIALALLLGVYIVRLTQTRVALGGSGAFTPPTHVLDLDIRPESLPAEIGSAARALWDRGEHRAALALLYRGMLSRLVHVHRLPIRDSSTEGDCLAMAAAHLAQRKRDYAVFLVQVWQRFVYGGEDVEPATVYALCHDFAPALDRASTVEAARQGTA